MAKRTIGAMLDFLSPISVIPGMGEKRIAAMLESGIETIGDLLYQFPRRYIDRSSIVPLTDINQYENTTCTVVGTVSKVRIERGRTGRLRVLIDDGNDTIELLWFRGVQFFSKSIREGMTLLVTGKVSRYSHFQIVHPSFEVIKDREDIQIKIVPYYSISGAMKDAGIQQKLFIKTIQWVLANLKHYPQILPEKIVCEKKFPPLQVCLHELHLPSSLEGLNEFRSRIKYEELYKLAIQLRLSKRHFTLPGRSMHPGDLPEKIRGMLPFALTKDQETAIEILYSDAASPKKMHRLLQGDVGCGKTLVAFFASLAAINSKYQVAWLAPTEALARQLYNLITMFCKQIGVTTALLISGLASQQKQKVLAELSAGTIRCIVGTHALLQPGVKFKDLGMIVVDEQHKFGVNQRLSLLEKEPAADFLLMSATPIPQSLAKTIYGDLDLVTIKEVPSGRLPVSTHIVPSVKRDDMEQFVLSQITMGAQAFYIVPRIEQDDTTESLNIRDINTVYSELKNKTFFSTSISILHGKMDNIEKEQVMSDFVAGSVKLLVATSIVEVGIDVPNAAVIIIENAERFGLAQLHQLRGRVGRGSKKSYCFLLPSENCDEKVINRLSMFCKSLDGFKIAEMDLKFRGPGEVTGLKQSGWEDLVMADILDDAEMFKEIQITIDSIQFPNNLH